MKKYIPDPLDLVCLVGMTAIVCGVYKIHHPSAWIVAGLSAVIYSVLASAATKRRKPE